MKRERLLEIFDKIKKVNIAIYGDYCLDVYWMMAPEGSEISVETGLQAESVGRHYSSPAGAANILNNAAALQPKSIMPIGVVGNDMHGRELLRQLQELKVVTSSLAVQKEKFETNVFTKKIAEGEEGIRVDFGLKNIRSKETDEMILKNLRTALEKCDALIFNQQVPGSLHNEGFIESVNKLFEEFSDRVILLDSRHYGNRFSHVSFKANNNELALLADVEGNNSDHTYDYLVSNAQKIFGKWHKPVFVTRGEGGILAVDKDGVHEVRGIHITNRLDTVGAGDTVLSALGLCLAAGVPPAEAIEFANLAACVTIQKINTTGTATMEEILSVFDNTYYIYNPELAKAPRMASFVSGAEIEICEPAIHSSMGEIKHAVFDHDGTISTLREGWEHIMEPVMIKAVLGDQYETASNQLYEYARARSLEFIDKTTGIQTIIQMEGLVKMVDEFNIVPKDKILDKFGYKEIYNDALMEMVNERTARFKKGQLGLEDYTVKGAVEFLKMLKDRGVKLYLASGTDRDDVINEAEVLGYADLFEGKIYGAVGDVSKYSKKMVIGDILRENKLKGHELMVLGDGPVEIQVCRNVEGIAVGIASDEVRRYGINQDKRKRLIRAGAQIVVPDFSERDKLVKFLFGEQ